MIDPAPHPSASGREAVVGREDELTAIASWLEDDSASSVIAISGQAGIGKTALVRAAVAAASARGRLVLACDPVEAEEGLAFAALSDLLHPILDAGLGQIAPARRRALEAALLQGDEGEVPIAERAVAFGALDVLRHAVPDAGLAVVVDDAQWLDSSSALVIGYMVRRMVRDPRVRVLVSGRTGSRRAAALVADVDPAAVAWLEIGPLSLGAIHRIVRTVLGAVPNRPQLTAIHTACEGNPFYAVEMARQIVGSETGRGVPPTSKTAAVDARFAELDAPGRDVLRVIALADTPTTALILAATGDTGPAALEGVIQAGLVVPTSDRLRFAHPLLARAVVTGSDASQVRDVHRRLAAHAATVDRRAFHQAHAAEGPDPVVAQLLSEAAGRAETRGALAAAADLHGLAADLTPDDPDAVDERRLAEARAAFRSGDPERARAILDGLCRAATRVRDRANLLLGVVCDETDGGDAGVGHFLHATQAGDPAIASEARRQLAQTLLFTGDLPQALGHAAAAVESADEAGDRVLVARALACRAILEFCLADPAWRATLDAALALEPDGAGEIELTPRAVAADLTRLSLDLLPAVDAYEELLERTRATGDLVGEGWALLGLASSWIGRADRVRAERWTAELEVFAEQTDTMALPALRCRAALAAAAGDLPGAREMATRGLATAESLGEALSARVFAGTLGAIELVAGDVPAAIGHLTRAEELARRHGLRDPGMRLALADLVEALAAAGEVDRARSALSDFAELAEDAGHPWSDAIVMRLQGIVAAAEGDLPAAQQALEAAVVRCDSLWSPVERARSRLALGRIVRRRNQRGRARELLQAAAGDLTAVPASPWRPVVDGELARIATSTDASGLTAAELRVARLVASGASNADVADALFVSVRTVEAHLSRIYRKLGVRSRSQLARRQFGDSTDAGGPART